MAHRSIRVAVEDTFTSLRPDRFVSVTDIQIGHQLFETLVGYDRSLRLEGRLAERWTCSPDGLGYRFALRPDARFHDGAPVTAAVVRDFLAGACLDRLAIRPFVASIEAIGAREVEITLRRPFAPLLDRLSAPFTAIFAPPAHADDPPAGTGAFGRPRRVDKTWQVEAMADQAVRAAELVPLAGGSAMWQALVEDRIDLAYECPYEIVARGSPDPSVVVTSCSSLTVNMLMFNVRSGPLSVPATRRAIARAIDKHQILAEVNRGVGEAPEGPIAPASPFFRPLAPRPEAARLERGEPPATLTVIAHAGFTPQWIEMFKHQLARAGTRCTVFQLPFPALSRAILRGSFEAALVGAPGFVDPDRVLFEVFHSAGRANYAGLRDPGFDDLVDRARLTSSFDERAALYAEACALLEELAPAVFLRHGKSIIARRTRVTGLEPHPLGDIFLAKAGWATDAA
ncbi:MAG TPA: ABC transporter substrate-binding protein [Kofleriaceae bacterium]|nr:ABC transporter substrate-binding protein [Kofleriaceae bacterium]